MKNATRQSITNNTLWQYINAPLHDKATAYLTKTINEALSSAYECEQMKTAAEHEITRLREEIAYWEDSRDEAERMKQDFLQYANDAPLMLEDCGDEIFCTTFETPLPF